MITNTLLLISISYLEKICFGYIHLDVGNTIPSLQWYLHTGLYS